MRNEVLINGINYGAEDLKCGLVRAKARLDTNEFGEAETFELRNQRPVFLSVGSDNGVKIDQADGMANRIGLYLRPIEGMQRIDEEKIKQELLNFDPKPDIYELAGLIAGEKLKQALQMGLFNRQKHPDTIFYAHDTVRIVIGKNGREKVLFKPKSEEEALKQLEMLSGNRVVDVIGTSLINNQDRQETILVYLIHKMHEIPERVRWDLADAKICKKIAGSLSILSPEIYPNGIDVMKQDKATEIWMGEIGIEPEFYGFMSGGQRYWTKKILNIILGGGYLLGEKIEKMIDKNTA